MALVGRDLTAERRGGAQVAARGLKARAHQLFPVKIGVPLKEEVVVQAHLVGDLFGNNVAVAVLLVHNVSPGHGGDLCGGGALGRIVRFVRACEYYATPRAAPREVLPRGLIVYGDRKVADWAAVHRVDGDVIGGHGERGDAFIVRSGGVHEGIGRARPAIHLPLGKAPGDLLPLVGVLFGIRCRVERDLLALLNVLPHLGLAAGVEDGQLVLGSLLQVKVVAVRGHLVIVVVRGDRLGVGGLDVLDKGHVSGDLALAVQVREPDADLAAGREVRARYAAATAADVLLALHKKVACASALFALARPVAGNGHEAAEREGMVRGVVAVDAAARAARAVVGDGDILDLKLVFKPDAATVALGVSRLKGLVRIDLALGAVSSADDKIVSGINSATVVLGLVGRDFAGTRERDLGIFCGVVDAAAAVAGRIAVDARGGREADHEEFGVVCRGGDVDAASVEGLVRIDVPAVADLDLGAFCEVDATAVTVVE